MTLSLFRFRSVPARIWAFAQMGFARLPLSRVPDLGFWKLLGTGTGEGFTPVPNTSTYAILCTWPDRETAQRRLDETEVFQRYRRRATEHWTLFLETASARGAWSGATPFAASGTIEGPLAALTRATVRPRNLFRFWQRVPSISAAIGSDPNVAFKMGLGEVPWFQQVTFSVWPDHRTMAAFARQGGPHDHAIRAVRDGNWFAEELYARFRIVGETGTWHGRSPLAHLSKKETVPA